MAMNQKQKLRVSNRLNLQREKEGKHPIYIRIYVDSKKSEIFSDYWIKASEWNSNQRMVKTNNPRADLINAFLKKLHTSIETDFYELRAQNQNTTALILKERYLGIDSAPSHKSILDAFDYHNTKMEEQVKIGKVVKKTHERYIITKNKVKVFMKHQYKLKDMPLPDLRLRYVTEFEHYLLTKDKLQSNTAHKYIKNLKKIMNLAVGLDWIPSNPFNNFRCSYITPKREVLSQEELDILRLKDISIQRLAEVRDVFVFCCYTGFAYSDIYQFEYNAISKGIDGEYWLSTNRQKTGVKESVPLLPIAMDIITKYRDHPYCISSNRLLPVNSNQRYNAYLKEIADICGIEKKITSHIARHTFATTVTLANGVPIETVSSMLGHSSIRTTQVYAKVIEKKVSEDMQNLKEKLSKKNEENPDQSKIG